MHHYAIRYACSLALAVALAACSGTTTGNDASADDVTNAIDVTNTDVTNTDVANTDVTNTDVANMQDASTEPCGSATCAGDQVCVHPCCGGAAPQCVMPDDAGTCPPGTSMGPCFGAGGMQFGCSTQCTPPPPFCAPRPTSGCQGNTCAPCPSGSGIQSGGSISCLCA